MPVNPNHGNAKRTRTCKRCKREMDKYFYFYSPEDDICKECKPDVRFIQRARKMAREEGVQALQDKIELYRRYIDLSVEVLAEFAKEAKVTVT